MPPSSAMLRGVIDRIVPADHLPGALATGADTYVQRVLARHPAAVEEALAHGLAELAARARDREGAEFDHLPPARKDALLAEIEHEAWFIALTDWVMESYYGMPESTEPRSSPGWRSVGFDPQRLRIRVPAWPSPPHTR